MSPPSRRALAIAFVGPIVAFVLGMTIVVAANHRSDDAPSAVIAGRTPMRHEGWSMARIWREALSLAVFRNPGAAVPALAGSRTFDQRLRAVDGRSLLRPVLHDHRRRLARVFRQPGRGDDPGRDDRGWVP